MLWHSEFSDQTVSASHSALTPGQLVLVLTLLRQAILRPLDFQSQVPLGLEWIPGPPTLVMMFVCWLVDCLTSQLHAIVSQGRTCSDNLTCCHTETELADPTFHLTQSQYTDTRPTSPSTDPITPGAWQGSHGSANFYVTNVTRPRKNPPQSGFEPGIFGSLGGRLNH